MAGELVVLIDTTTQECELELTISYFLNDDRIFWTPGLQVELDNAQSDQATLTGYIIVTRNRFDDPPLLDRIVRDGGRQMKGFSVDLQIEVPVVFGSGNKHGSVSHRAERMEGGPIPV